MKKRTKLTFAGIVTLGAVMLLSGCTASFCSKDDKANILYAFDYGVSDYYSASDDALKDLTEAQRLEQGYEKVWEGNSNVYFIYRLPTSSSSGLGKTIADAAKSYIKVPSDAYFKAMDKLVLERALTESGKDFTNPQIDLKNDILPALDNYGYLKFAGEGNEKLWKNWEILNQDLRDMTEDPASGLTIDDLPTNDWITLYQKDMNNILRNYRSCLAISKKKYGYYGYANGAQYRENDPIYAINGKASVTIEKKDWGYAWKKGFLEGLLVFPVGWLTESLISGMSALPEGVPQLLAILFVTIIVRSLVLLITFKSQSGSAKMQALQPEITKIQNKYPNANKNTYEKQQMAAEMNKLYKKNKINPLGPLLAMVVQFPIFICVYSAFQGCASLSTGAFCNLHFSDSISGVIFSGANWGNGSAVTALILFLLMAIAQTASILVPQFIQKKKRKSVASLGKNPSQNDQQSKMKMFTYIMVAMIVFMGFTLPSAMGVYWFVGALFTLCQTLIFEAINNKKSKQKGR